MRDLQVKTFLPLGVCVAIVLFCVLPLGCGTRTESQQREESNLKPLAIYCIQYHSERGQPPASEEEFKQFVRAQGLDADVDGLFISSRDGEPYVILCGPDAANSQIVAYERVGVGGKRFVADNLGGIEEVDETRFRELVPNAP